MVKVAAFCLALMLTIAGPGEAHPLHSSFTQITRDRGDTIAISIRLFADDFGATLDSLREKSGGATKEVVAEQYFARSVFLFSVNRTPVPLVWCGMRSEGNVVWVCARAMTAASGQLRVRNALMFDRFSDQISIIKWTRGSKTRTLVLSARAPEAGLE